MNRTIIRLALAAALVLLPSAPSLALSEGPNNPGAAFNDPAFGIPAWTDPGNALASDNMSASAAPGGGNTQYLHANNFGFTVPGPALIEGIEVNVERRSALGTIDDSRVRIVKGGVVGATEKADPGSWPTTDTVITYGAPNDLWGETWTAADINAANFGVVLSATDAADAAFVDHITIQVYFTLCGPAPAAGCRTSTKSLLIVKDNASDDTKDKIIWKWIKGASTTQSEFGNPTSTSATGFCIYENGALIANAVVPPDLSKWQTISTKGYKYKDSAGAASSITKVLLKGSSAGKSKVLVKGKGMNLPDPNPALTLPVKVQVVSGDSGICFEAEFTSASKNEAGSFKGKF